jgi:glucose-6-phosphate isomerase
MAEPIQFDFANCFPPAIAEKHGIDPAWLDELRPRLAEALEALEENRGRGMTEWMELPGRTELADRIRAAAEAKAGRHDDVVVLGIGGSALGTIALRTALLHPFHNQLPAEKRGGLPRLHVLDNVDPVPLAAFFDEMIDLERTLFILISKSGTTAETMAQYLTAVELIENCLGADAVKDHLVAITDREKGVLRPIANRRKLESWVIPDGVGGRFSVLSPVGLVPAALAGIDIHALLEGAAEMDRRSRGGDPLRNPAALFAAIHYLADTRHDARISVMMPYASGLKDVADWYAQLWAESLGKAENRAGKAVHVGQTPVKALGATDQHSQVQLYREGPFDKVTTFLRVEHPRSDLRIPELHPDEPKLAYLGGHTFGELLEAERTGTELAMTDAERMNLTISLPEVSAHAVGQLLYALEMATAISGELYDIDAFNQPGVEAGKIATYALMGRSGYESQAKEIAARPPHDPRWIL